MDRIDLHVEVPAVPFQELRTKAAGPGSAEMRERVLAARERQSARGFIKAKIPSSQIRKICPFDDSGERTLELAVKRMGFSARAHAALGAAQAVAIRRYAIQPDIAHPLSPVSAALRGCAPG